MQTPGITFGPFVFDPRRRLLKRDSVELQLPPRVLGVLEVLLGRAGEVVPRQELIDTVWKDAFVTDTSLAEAVSVLRQTLGDDPQAPSYIQTLHRRGYRFVAPIQGGALDPSPADEAENVRAPMAASPSIGGQLIPWSVAAVCAVLATVAVWQTVVRRDAATPPVTRFAIAAAPGTRFDARAPALALSPEGSRLAWSGCDESTCRLYVRASDRLDPMPLAGTDDAAAPFFSPDGRWIGFFADGHLKKIAATGGAPVALADAADALGAVWTSDGAIIYAGAGPGLRRVRDTGGEWTTLTLPSAADGEVRHAWPAEAPGRGWLMFSVSGIPDAEGGTRVAMVRLDAPKKTVTLMAGANRAAGVGDDVIVFSVGSELQAAVFDARSGAIVGAPQTVAGDIARSGGAGQFAVSHDGALLSLGPSPPRDAASLVWWSSAKSIPERSAWQDASWPNRPPEALALSPDGRRVAGVDRAEAGRSDVWIADLERGTASRLTHDGINATPIWTPDGKQVVFASSDGDSGSFGIHVRDADALNTVRRLYAGTEHAFPSSVAPDASMVAFVTRAASTGADIWGTPLAGGPAVPLIRTPFDDTAAVFSPDGGLIAYQSNDAGRWEIYVHRRSDGRRITVSTDGGTDPFWSADGRSLFYRSRERLLRAGVAADGSTASAPEIVTTVPDATPIGVDARQRVLFQRRLQTPAGIAVLALQWVREVRQVLGPPATAMPR